MDRLITHLNILLVCLNIIGLGTYLYARIIYKQQYEYLLIIFIISISSIQRYVKHIKCHFCIIATFAVIATFIKNQKIDLIIISISFSMTVNLGYALINRCNDEMKIKIYESLLNLSFTVAVIFSLCSSYIQTSKITEKIVVLISTLPNFFLSLPQSQPQEERNDENGNQSVITESRTEVKISNKLIYYLNPMLCETWVYALGYSIGIYLNIFEIFPTMLTKYIKYLIIALFILIETLTYRYFIKLICLFFRSLLVFHYQRFNLNYECYFILVYIILKNMLHDDAINIYLMVGYVLIAISLWRDQYRISYEENKEQSSLINENMLKQPLFPRFKSSRILEKQIEKENDDKISEASNLKLAFTDSRNQISS